MTELVHPESSRALIRRLRPSGNARQIATSDWLRDEVVTTFRIRAPETVRQVRRVGSGGATPSVEVVGGEGDVCGKRGVEPLGISLGTVRGVEVELDKGREIGGGIEEIEEIDAVRELEDESGNTVGESGDGGIGVESS